MLLFVRDQGLLHDHIFHSSMSTSTLFVLVSVLPDFHKIFSLVCDSDMFSPGIPLRELGTKHLRSEFLLARSSQVDSRAFGFPCRTTYRGVESVGRSDTSENDAHLDLSRIRSSVTREFYPNKDLNAKSLEWMLIRILAGWLRDEQGRRISFR